MQTHSLTLSDGRTLSYSEYGVRDGDPILYCHGSPGTRLDLTLFGGLEPLLAKHRLRIVAPDRPGMGDSSFQPGRTLTTWPADVTELTAHIGLKRFALLSLSNGAPYALAVAAALPERVTAVTLVSPAAPLGRKGALKGMGSPVYWWTAMIHPWLTEQMLGMALKSIADAPPAQQKAIFPEADWRVLSLPGVYRCFMEAVFVEGTRNGTKGLAFEAKLLLQPWNIALNAIPHKVKLWHGDADKNAPLHHAQYLQTELPRAELHVKANEGHMSLIWEHLPEILETLAQDMQGALSLH